MSLITYLNPAVVKGNSIEGIKIKDGSITSSKIDSSVASKKYVDDTIASAISASDAMVFKGTIGTGGTSESLPSTAIVGDTYKVIALTTIPGASSYTGLEETAKVGDLIVAISAEPKWIVVPSGDDEIKTLVQSITWSDLKVKRDAGSLMPGMQYRITDYACTTTQSNTKSAGHQFDIIVVADDERTLNETARAIKHPVAEGETDYFANNDLSVWQIWYCLDNDTTRFAWADSANGKGVIYRMIDEFNNDVPYDFKNIQFKHPNDTTTYPHYYYTFASDNVENNTDYSLDIINECYSNIIMEYITECKRSINKILFIGSKCYCNSFGPNSSSNFLGYKCYCNSFNSGCKRNKLYYNCAYNIFADGCESNSLGKYCTYNTFSTCCTTNSISDHGYKNSFGAICRYNSLGYACKQNNFGNGCEKNYLSEYSESNSFGSGCLDVYFDNSYYRNNHFGDGCQYIRFKGVETASEKNQIQNYNFSQGLQGDFMFYLTIEGIRNCPYETKVERDSNGNLKEFCLADLIYDENDNSYYYSASFIGEI